MAKTVFAFPPRLGDCAKICLVGASVGGLPTRLQRIFFIYIQPVSRGHSPIQKPVFLFRKKTGSKSYTHSTQKHQGRALVFLGVTIKPHIGQNCRRRTASRWPKFFRLSALTRRLHGNLPRQSCPFGALGYDCQGRFCVSSAYPKQPQKRNRHFKPHDTMALLLHGISSSMVTYALPPPLHQMHLALTR